ncbi:MAG: 16S rRNA processing protein RimM [Limisphaerales bacterium]|jgi:16S rRNA processing protein RimM
MSGDTVIKLGSIIGTHGVKGAVRIKPEPNIGALLEPEALFFLAPTQQDNYDLPDSDEPQTQSTGNKIPWFVEDISLGATGEFILKFEELDSKEDAGVYRGHSVWVFIDDVEEEEDYHDWAGWIGMKLLNKQGTFIGFIEDVLERGPQPLALITYENREVYIPLAVELIIETDEAAKEITLHIPDGLLDL